MTRQLILLILISTTIKLNGQDVKIAYDRYRIHVNWDYQDTAYFQIGTKKDVLKSGWTIIETKGGVQIQRTLLKDTTITSKIDSAIKISGNWKASEVKHSNDAPDKLLLNPDSFTDKKNDHLNKKCYLKIPENSRIVLMHSFIKFSAITIPFAVRPSLNDTIGSKITTDLKIGGSVSYNMNWETFKNRRIEAKKSVVGISTGLGFGFSKITLDNTSTSLIEKPYKYAEDGLAFFINPGIGLNLKGFQIVGFYGWDFGLTKNVADWNYNKKKYLGIGLGIDITSFGKL